MVSQFTIHTTVLAVMLVSMNSLRWTLAMLILLEVKATIIITSGPNVLHHVNLNLNSSVSLLTDSQSWDQVSTQQQATCGHRLTWTFAADVRTMEFTNTIQQSTSLTIFNVIEETLMTPLETLAVSTE